MPGAGGIAYAVRVLNFRRLEFSSLAQDTEKPIALKYSRLWIEGEAEQGGTHRTGIPGEDKEDRHEHNHHQMASTQSFV